MWLNVISSIGLKSNLLCWKSILSRTTNSWRKWFWTTQKTLLQQHTACVCVCAFILPSAAGWFWFSLRPHKRIQVGHAKKIIAHHWKHSFFFLLLLLHTDNSSPICCLLYSLTLFRSSALSLCLCCTFCRQPGNQHTQTRGAYTWRDLSPSRIAISTLATTTTAPAAVMLTS